MTRKGPENMLGFHSLKLNVHYFKCFNKEIAYYCMYLCKGHRDKPSTWEIAITAKINRVILNLTINIIHIQIINSTRMPISVWIKQFLITNLTIHYKYNRDKTKIDIRIFLNENITKIIFEKVRTYTDFTFELKNNGYYNYGQITWHVSDHYGQLGHILLKTFISVSVLDSSSRHAVESIVKCVFKY
jgi:hypothetical protein